MNKIYDRLYLGNLKDSLNYEMLEKNRIKYILSVTNNGKVRFLDKDYMITHVDDRPGERLIDLFPTLLAYIDEAMTNGNILVHCDMGISRSASVIIAWLMTRKGMSLCDAYSYVKSKRSIIQPNPGFIKQLKTLEKTYF